MRWRCTHHIFFLYSLFFLPSRKLVFCHGLVKTWRKWIVVVGKAVQLKRKRRVFFLDEHTYVTYYIMSMLSNFMQLNYVNNSMISYYLFCLAFSWTNVKRYKIQQTRKSLKHTHSCIQTDDKNTKQRLNPFFALLVYLLQLGKYLYFLILM